MNRTSLRIGIISGLLIAGIVFLEPVKVAGKASAQQNQTDPIPEDSMIPKGNEPIKTMNRRSESASIGQDRIIWEDEIIEDNAVVVGGDLTVYGQVNGDAVCIGGDLKVGPQAVIRGNLVNVGGKLDVDPSAKTYKDRVNIGSPFGFLKGIKGIDRQKLGGTISIVMDCVYLLLFMFFALLLTTFMPRQFKNIEEKLNNEFPRSILMGIVSMIGFPIIILAFVITLVGILVVPFLLLALTLSSLAGYIAFSKILGGRFLPKKAIMLQILAGLLLLHSPALIGDLLLLPGGTILSVIGYVFRNVGIILIISVNFIGLGAVVCSFLDRRRTVLPQTDKSNGLTGNANNTTA